MRKYRWLMKTMLTVSLASFCTLGVAESNKDESSEGQTGIASYFNDRYHGQRTANGERYDKNAMTAAHVSLPFGTLVHVVNLRNNKSIDVRINSRTHHRNKRILDLSSRAAKELGFYQAGLTKVKMTIVQLGDA